MQLVMSKFIRGWWRYNDTTPVKWPRVYIYNTEIARQYSTTHSTSTCICSADAYSTVVLASFEFVTRDGEQLLRFIRDQIITEICIPDKVRPSISVAPRGRRSCRIRYSDPRCGSPRCGVGTTFGRACVHRVESVRCRCRRASCRPRRDSACPPPPHLQTRTKS